MPVHLLQIVQQAVGHTVRTGADDQAHHPVCRQGFLVFPLQVFQFTIRIGIGLEIGEILHLRIFVCKELLALFQLAGNGFLRTAIIGVEGLVVAIGATADSFVSIPVGARKTGIQRYFLYLIGKISLQKKRELIIERRFGFHTYSLCKWQI